MGIWWFLGWTQVIWVICYCLCSQQISVWRFWTCSYQMLSNTKQYKTQTSSTQAEKFTRCRDSARLLMEAYDSASPLNRFSKRVWSKTTGFRGKICSRWLLGVRISGLPNGLKTCQLLYLHEICEAKLNVWSLHIIRQLSLKLFWNVASILERYLVLFFLILSPFRVYINIICVRVCTGVARSVITLLLLINSAAVPCVCVCMCGLLKGPGRVIDGSFSTVNTCKRTHTHTGDGRREGWSYAAMFT